MPNDEAKNKDVTAALYQRNFELAIITKNLSLLKKLYHVSLVTLNRDELIQKLADTIQMDLELSLVAITADVQPTTEDAKSRIFPLMAHDKQIGLMSVTLNRNYAELSEHERSSIESTVDVVAIALDRANARYELEAANAKLVVADRMKTQFLSFASHQVKSPMTVVKGYAELIMDGSFGAVPDKVKETAQKIKESSNRLIALVNNLLDLRKLEEGKVEYSMTDFDIVGLVKNIVEEQKTVAKAKGLELTLEAPAELITVHVDQEKIRQVIQNLVDNSIKYTEHGYIRVQLRMTNNECRITVEDSGIGIPADLLPNLFEQFNRGSVEAKKIQGTGLGLYIAKMFMLAHKGTIRAESEGTGKGSTFTMELPTV